MSVSSNICGLLLLVAAFLPACRPAMPAGIEREMSRLPDQVDYNFHVKPILSDRCFACHGPDAENRKGDLRLDIEESAYSALESGNGRAIIPRQTRHSQLVERILSDDPELGMPPPESNLTLTDPERATLIKWIKQGGQYKPHWAFTKPVKAAVPDEGQDWAINEVDQFVAERLRLAELTPSPPADRSQLIRRLYFDLTGLPPSLEELWRWKADEGSDYYERLVEDLLSRPAFGERMAAHWLDVARFADSEGYLDDFHHTFWPYRDWVIEAFNENLPYDQFILWQIGGDQVPGATQEQRLATAFNRNHKQNSEGGIIPEEFRVEYVADRTNTLGAAFLGLTVGCARCHDHKYDPISQDEYYELFGFFNSTVERGDGIFGYNAVEYGQQVPNVLSMNAGPVLALPSEEVAAIRQMLVEQIEQQEQATVQAAQRNEGDIEQWCRRMTDARSLIRAVDKATVSHLTFDGMQGGKDRDLVAGTAPASYWGEVTSVPGKKGLAVRSDADGQYVADGSRSSFERMEPFTISFWVQRPKDFADGHVIYNGNDRIQGYRGWDVVLDSNRLHFRLNHAHPYQSLDVRAVEPLPLDEWVHYVWTYDGSSRAEGMAIYRNGMPDEITIERNHLYRSTEPYTDPRATVYKPYKGIIIGNRHYDQDFTGGLLDEVRILDREADIMVAKYLYDATLGVRSFEAALSQQPQALGRFYDLFVDDHLERQREKLRRLQAREIETIDTVQEIMVMGDMTRDRPTYVLERGVYDAHGEQVQRDVPETIFGWPEDLPRNRYGLGQWLVHPDHPLTARVAVNQIWYLMFGRGLVETVEDFGNQGALPTHPELLDWLAMDFVENGWDLKRLIRQLVLSATYRQSSRVTPELLEADPQNYLLARGPRYRRSAEMVRDNILAASDLLDYRVGGPSAFPYQPPGLWKEVMTHTFFPEYEIDYDDGLYRRSIYTFWKRNMPPPSMLIFDAASRAECQVRRQKSNTPLQALVLLNDPQVIEGCRVLAERTWQMAKRDRHKAIELAFEMLTSRVPSEREAQLLRSQLEEEHEYFASHRQDALAYLNVGHRTPAPEMPALEIAAIARVANTIVNSTEAYYKN